MLELIPLASKPNAFPLVCMLSIAIDGGKKILQEEGEPLNIEE